MEDKALGLDETAKALDALPVNGVQKYKLSRPITFQGETYEELNLDFEKITTGDIENIERALTVEGEVIMSAQLSQRFQIRVVALAVGVPPQVIRAFPIADGMALTARAQAFLLRVG
jgi:hypothetical protein